MIEEAVRIARSGQSVCILTAQVMSTIYALLYQMVLILKSKALRREFPKGRMSSLILKGLSMKPIVDRLTM
jgi:hypothetical protein